MNARRKGALLWGVVGLLTFLVLLQGYEIVQGISVELPVKVGATVIVGVASTAITYLATGHLDAAAPANGSPAPDDPAATPDSDPTDDAGPSDESSSAEDAGRDDSGT